MKSKNQNLFSDFSVTVQSLLSKKFPKTYFVGGAVRNILLGKKIVDVDIATSARPEQVSALLQFDGISCSNQYQKLGVIIAKKGSQTLEITTFRKEVYLKTRFPKVAFSTSTKVDSSRRDFTVNALYYSPQTNELLDFHNGLNDIQNKHLKFIGNTQQRIEEDPLRIIRAFKFSKLYNLKIDTKTLETLNANMFLLKKISAQRLQKEIYVAQSKKVKNYLQKVIHSNT